jgi:hypothetical protein
MIDILYRVYKENKFIGYVQAFGQKDAHRKALESFGKEIRVESVVHK